MPIWLIFTLIGVIIFAVMQIVLGNKSAQEQEVAKVSIYKKIYTALSKNFITQKSIRKIYTKLATLSVYKQEELYLLTSQYFVMSWAASVGLVLMSLVIFKDFITVLICVAFAVLLNTTLIEKQLDKQYFKVLQATGHAIGSMRQEYMKTNSIVEALNDADIDDILKKPFDEIYTILTSTDSEIKLQEFYSSTPFRTLQTLVGICYNINNEGDSKDVYGNSNFIQALTILSTDINAEVLKITTQKKKFGFLEYLPFAPILGIGLIETFFVKIMPGTALIYGGPIGYLARVLTIVSAIMSYTFVARINMTVPVSEDDRKEWVTHLIQREGWVEFIDNIKAKNASARKLNKRIKDSLSRKSIDEIYTEKVVYGVVAMIVSIVVMMSVVSMGGEFVRNSTQQLSLIASDEMEKFSKETILALDQKYFEMRDALQPPKTLNSEIQSKVDGVKKTLGLTPKGSVTEKKGKYPNLKEDVTITLVKSYLPTLTELQVLDQVKRLDDKYKSVQGVSFKWWYVWVAFLIGFIGWKSPEIGIRIRRQMVITEAEDDFLQLQTLVSIFMTTSMDTLDVLYEMSQHSRVHKDMLTYCYHGYPSNPIMELTRLQSKTPMTEFKRFIGKLKLTVDDLSLNEAFSDLYIEREQVMRLREVSMFATINKKRAIAGPVSLIPLGILVVGELLIPLGYLGYNEFMNALTMM